MASVNIPFGGGEVTVNVPDFAMEGTQQDVLEQASRQTDALQKIAQSMGISIQNDRQETKSNKDLSSAIKKGNSDEDKNFARLNKNIKSMNALSAASALNRSSGSETLSGLAGKDGILGAMGLTAMGAQVGTLFGIMEEFGSALGALRRTGGGLSVDLLQLQDDASNVGLDMQTLSKITVENGNAIRSLGVNTADGTNQFLSLTSSLREATRDMGFFGMGTKEMSTMLIDEIELRRSTRNEAFLEAGARDQLVASMTKSLKLNEVMAGLTGQDVQDRIKARNEFRKDAVVAAVRSKMTQKQIDAQNELVSGLAGLGSIGAAGGPIQQAIINTIGGVNMDYKNTAFTELANAAQPFGINLREILEDAARAVQGEVDPETMTSVAADLVNQFANIDISGTKITERALTGQEGAALLLQVRQEAFASVTGEGTSIAQTVNDNMTTLESAAGRAGTALTGMAGQIEVAAAQLKVTVAQSTLKAFNVDPNNPEGLMGFVSKLEQLPSSETFKQAALFVTEVATLATGAQGLMATVGIGNEGKTDIEKRSEQVLMVQAVAKAAGVSLSEIAVALGGPTGKFSAMLAGLDTAIFASAMTAGLTAAYNRETPMPITIIDDETLRRFQNESSDRQLIELARRHSNAS